MNLPTVPMPGGVAGLIGSQIPAHVQDAEDEAVFAMLSIEQRRQPMAPEQLAEALATVARANKVLAAYNPGLIVKAGGPR
ncbi:hypothetical protein QMZ92_23815 [Streptomyces sp. HNM0645]|uniref:hypothetical protein n=1 Tax=Streptomyces sp. HNM0645 TaxID=2782343 RepID=UPI0024B67933|nr:hypothetical protein [Streptomyces sp. HNM0645]MDI9887313.1 hypothetical protein [Streptomyces sp. HNM0645]